MIKIFPKNSGACGHTCSGHSIQSDFSQRLASLLHRSLFHDNKNLKATHSVGLHCKDAQKKRWKSSTYRAWTDSGNNPRGYGGDRSEKASPQWQRPAADKKLSYGRQGNGENMWEKSSRSSGPRQDGRYSGESGRQNWTRLKNSEGSRPDSSRGGYARQTTGWEKGEDRGSGERVGFANDSRWHSRESSPPLVVEGQALYGVAPIVSALQASRREFYSLYMQESLLENIDKRRRKDKEAVSFIEKTAKRMGVTVKVASKHDLNILADNRPHQGLVLDASPLDMVPVDMLEPPLYQENKCPVWVALDEITDPQNFGAILRSAYFLGADGVVVCAKNSAPLSAVVSKASAGALEVMEVQYCRNMMKFLEKSRENGWRVVGASAQASAVPLQELPTGIATILVLGNEGKGMRTNVKRACDQLVSIAGISNSQEGSKIDCISDFSNEEEEELDQVEVGEEEEEGIRRGAEVAFMSGPAAVDSLNVSVAAGIMLYELLGRNSTHKDVVASKDP